MCLSDCSKCQYFDRNPHHRSDIVCSLNPAYASMWKQLNSLDKYSLDCLPIDDCREFELDPSFEKKTIALSLNFFDWQKLERETSNPTIAKALKDTVIGLNLSLTQEQWQKIANSTLIPAIRIALESEGIEAKSDAWIHVDSSCIDAIAYARSESILKIRFNSSLVYRYFRVTESTFLDFCDAPSKGRFFNQHIRGRSLRGERLYDSCPRNRGSNISLIGALSLDGLIATMSLRGSVNTEVFLTYVGEILLPQLWRGAFVIMDNLPVHKADATPRRRQAQGNAHQAANKIREMIQTVGAQVVFLPPYSPDLSPIELCWSKLKQCLRTAKARTTQAINQALTEIINHHISGDDAVGWFEHCGLFI